MVSPDREQKVKIFNKFKLVRMPISIIFFQPDLFRNIYTKFIMDSF